MRQVDWSAAEHLLSPFSSPSFWVKWLYDFGFSKRLSRKYVSQGREGKGEVGWGGGGIEPPKLFLQLFCQVTVSVPNWPILRLHNSKGAE
jgi:hypothetical protein